MYVTDFAQLSLVEFLSNNQINASVNDNVN